jgi:hypothetical protein
MMRFPRMHIAESVVNRILNTYDGVQDLTAPVMDEPPPAPNPAEDGAMLTEALRVTRPVGSVSPEGAQVAAAAAMGQSPLEGLLSGGSLLGVGLQPTE